MSIHKHLVHHYNSGLKLTLVFLLGVFIGAVGVVIALNIFAFLSPEKTSKIPPPGVSSFNGSSGSSYGIYPQAPPPGAASRSGR